MSGVTYIVTIPEDADEASVTACLTRLIAEHRADLKWRQKLTEVFTKGLRS